MATINLKKNQVVDLTKSDPGKKLSIVYVGANWGAIKHGTEKTGFFSRLFGMKDTQVENVDLDASILMYDKNFVLRDTVYFGSKISYDCSIRHSGDDLTGDTGDEDDEDNEVITINLLSVSSEIKYLVAILNSYSHQKFDEIPYIKLRIFTGGPKTPKDILANFRLDNDIEFKGKEAIVMGYFFRTSGNDWKFKASGVSSKERSISQISKGSALEVIKNG